MGRLALLALMAAVGCTRLHGEGGPSGGDPPPRSNLDRIGGTWIVDVARARALDPAVAGQSDEALRVAFGDLAFELTETRLRRTGGPDLEHVTGYTVTRDDERSLDLSLANPGDLGAVTLEFQDVDHLVLISRSEFGERRLPLVRRVLTARNVSRQIWAPRAGPRGRGWLVK